jgi:hypothetical protein
MSLEEVIHLIMKDSDFAKAVRSNARVALESAGICLDQRDLSALDAAILRGSFSGDTQGAFSNIEDWHITQFHPITS